MHMIFIWLLAAAFASAGLFNAIATSTTRSNFVRWGILRGGAESPADWKYRPAILVAIPATRAVGLVLLRRHSRGGSFDHPTTSGVFPSLHRSVGFAALLLMASRIS